MKIAIDRSPLSDGNQHRGIGQYTRMLVSAIQKYSNITLVDDPKDADVVHVPYFDLFFMTLPLVKPRPTILTIHDVIPLVFHDAYPPGIRGKMKSMAQRLSLSNIQHIVTDSDCSTRDVIHYLQQPQQKVSTVYLAPDERFVPATKLCITKAKDAFSLTKPYFLYVGDINYNKNLPQLFQVFSQYKNDFDLVMVSKTLSRSNPAARDHFAVIDTLNLSESIKVLTVPSDDVETMKGIYSGCEWYIQPSLYEGFGLPVLEAQACGAPVISSLGGSLKEISGDSVIVFDESGIAKALASSRNEYIQKSLLNCQRFSWKQTVQLMEQVYDQAAK